MANDDGIRSESESLSSIPQVLEAIKRTRNTDDLAMLLMITTQLYADASCRCEEKAAAYGEDSAEARTCNRFVTITQKEIHETFKELVSSIKG